MVLPLGLAVWPELDKQQNRYDYMAVGKDDLVVFDGRTPNTRKVWKAKHRCQGFFFSATTYSEYKISHRAAQIAEWNAQMQKQGKVTREFGFFLR